MVPECYGTRMLWYQNVMVPECYGTRMLWYQNVMVPECYSTRMVPAGFIELTCSDYLKLIAN